MVYCIVCEYKGRYVYKTKYTVEYDKYIDIVTAEKCPDCGNLLWANIKGVSINNLKVN